MAGRKNQGLFRLTAAKAAGGACFTEIDKMIEEVMAFRLPGEDADLDSGRNRETAAMAWRLPRAERPRCCAETRTRSSCQRQALPNGRCPNHGGLSTGPRTKAGRARIAEAQRKRWQAYREMKNQKRQNSA
jgi:hypothetical protein